jgi:hypothetical protein
MKFKKLNKLQKIMLKAKSAEAYKNYKFMNALQPIAHPQVKISSPHEVHFMHSGNSGDIIYSIPAMYALAEGRKIHLHLKINEKGVYGKMRHPLGSVMLNEKMVSMLQPLLLNQPLIETCEIYSGQHVDVDLTAFRQYPFNYRMGHICRWYFWVFGVNGDLGKPWLQAKPDPSVNDAIVIARSQRYRMPGIDYRFLSSYPHKVFVGVEEEYDDMKKMIPDIEFRKVKDFLELASIIAGSKFFIGNQSFPFSIAEGLKVRRLLEVFHLSPNVIVEGADGYDFCYQPQFEKLAAYLYDKRK